MNEIGQSALARGQIALRLHHRRTSALTPKTIYREITAVGLLIASHPIDWMVQQVPQFGAPGADDPIILSHGYGGTRSSLLGLASYLRLSGFSNLHFFEYSRKQTAGESTAQIAELADRVAAKSGGVHLIGHSMGGYLLRRYARNARPGMVRALITLGAPYSIDQRSPDELAIFGDEDPIIAAPQRSRIRAGMFRELVILDGTGHLALIYHPEALKRIETELIAKSRRRQGAQLH
jgi:pimeloyl-ACP methyl ester carboxylesterase